MQTESLIGHVLTCAETGIKFRGKSQGITVNYAHDNEGRIYSDKGVDIRETRELLDRTKPVFAYVSEDGNRITGWKGNILGRITLAHKIALTRQSFVHGRHIHTYTVRDVHGGWWFGRGNPGIAIKLRPYKGKPR